MNSHFRQTGIVLVMILLLVGCTSKGDTKHGKEARTERPAVAVETAEASTSALAEGVDVVGSLTPKFETDVKSQIPGLIREVYVNEWVSVRKNAPLARIDVGETEALARRAEAAVETAKAGFLQAQVAAQRAEREKARIAKLREFGLATQQGLEDSESESLAAAARVEAARAQIRAAEEDLHHVQVRLTKGIIRSPMDGVVSLRDVNVGDLASDTGAAKPLFRIVDNRILNLTVTVPSVAMAGLRVGNPLTFTVDSLPGKTFSGKVMYINPVVNEADRSLKVIAEVDNTAGELRGGLFAKGRIVTGERKDVLQVPRPALTGLNLAAKKAGIFVVEADKAIHREVTTGTVIGDSIEIVSGLKKGERYVVRGGFNLRDGDRVVFAAGGGK